jgi:cell division protease FtsH
LLLVALVLLAGSFVWSLSFLAPKPRGRQISVSQLNALAEQKRISSATFRDQDAQIVGSFLCAVPKADTGNTATTGQSGATSTGTGSSSKAPRCQTDSTTGTASKTDAFWMPYPKSDSATNTLITMAVNAGASVSVDPQTSKSNIRIVATIVLPLMMLANLFALLFASGKGSSSGIGEVEMFGSIGKGKMRRRQKAPVTFANIAGADEALEELKEVRDYLAAPERYEQIGAQPPKGVLLIGPPGCGKTLLAKAVAGEVGVPFFSVAGAEFVESLVGVGAARVRDLFRRVRAAAPAILFIDELDAAGRKRAQGGGSGGSDEREQTLNQILVEMDGFEISSGIVVMGATNRPDILDPALLRPGRFDRHVTVERPDLVGRTRILELHARGKPVSPEVDLSYVARRTPGFSGADLANVVNEAALLAVRQGKEAIEVTDLEEAVQRVLTGAGRRGRMLSPQERKRASYHESGHVIVAAAAGRFDEVHRVSTGRNIGSTEVKRQGDASVLTRGQLRGRLLTLLAGVASEELVFGEPSTGSESDLQAATDLARDMIGRYGMSAKLGRARLLDKDVDEFLDAEIPLGPVSGQTHYDLDVEIRRLLDEAEQEATSLLITHRQTLDSLSARLEIEEMLEGPDLDAVLALVRPEVELFAGMIPSDEGANDASTADAEGVA